MIRRGEEKKQFEFKGSLLSLKQSKLKFAPTSLKKIYYVDTLNIYSSVALTRVPAVYVINVRVIRFYWMLM